MRSNRETVRLRTTPPQGRAATSMGKTLRPRRASPLFVVALTSLGCTVHPGLANAPALGTVPPSNGHEHDVIANGRDSCERSGGGSPLRAHLPPCESAEPIVHVGALPEPQPATGFEFMYLRWVQCSRLDEYEDGYAVREAVAVGEPFPRPTWSNRCVDWTH